MFYVHFLATFVSLYREIKSNNVGMMADFMRINEVLMIFGYIGSIMMCMDSYNILSLQGIDIKIIDEINSNINNATHCMEDETVISQWAGNC